MDDENSSGIELKHSSGNDRLIKEHQWWVEVAVRQIFKMTEEGGHYLNVNIQTFSKDAFKNSRDVLRTPFLSQNL